jgi:DNA-directed RNA polymerase specialized sigma24 family protein
MRERGLTYRQIADEMNVSTGQVHNYLNSVSACLQKELDS